MHIYYVYIYAYMVHLYGCIYLFNSESSGAPRVIQKLLNEISLFPCDQRQMLPLSCAAGETLLAIQDPRLVTVDFRFLQEGQKLEFVSILQLDQGKYHFKFMRNKLLFFTFCTR